MALFDSRLSSEFKRQLIGGRNKLFDRILAVLEHKLDRPARTGEWK